MKNLKLGLGALAFTLAIGAAVATNANNSQLDLCTSNPNPPSATECPTGTAVDCCYTFNQQTGQQIVWKKRS